ncbi:c-type cytochrome [Cupriavidus gilardii]|uniref:c-type cytochrome n=1 Tax=Cupriavidus gilardii TaxID=82541 RepID=UPI001571B0E9|nr:c-type cytochrome [Cupriavidus gilardii]NSX05715.1 c-type cytochrome [Cupriavidus gilardii]
MNTPDEVEAGRRRATWWIAALVLGIGAFPLYGLLYQVWPDLFAPSPGPRQASPAAGAGQAPAPGAASAPAAAASEAVVRRSTDFQPKEPAWSQALRAAADDAANDAGNDAGKGAQQRGATIAASGNGAGAMACVSCHAAAASPAASGAAGAAVPAGAFPSLVGMPAEYLAKQLFDYREGRRVDPVMAPIAKALKDDEIAAVARYYASQPAPTLTLSEGGQSAALTLHAAGDNGRALPACANCHGVEGEGQGFLLPRLTGQPADYLARQLDAFRTGNRHNDDDGAMRGIAQRLGEADARALASFYAQGGTR